MNEKKTATTATSQPLFDESIRDHNAEAGVLCVLFMESSVPKVDDIREEYFDNLIHRGIYRAIKSLHDEGHLVIDPISVIQRLQAMGKGDDQHAIAVSQIADFVMGPAAYEYHLNIIKNKYHARLLINSFNRGVEQIKANVEADKIATALMDDIIELYKDTSDSNIVDTSEANTRVLKMIDTYVSKDTFMARTWFSDLDRMMGYIGNGSLVVIGGRPGMGKSVLAMCLILNNITNGITCGLINYEMSTEDTTLRMLSNIAHEPYSSIIRSINAKDEASVEGFYKSIVQAMDQIVGLPFYQEDNPRGDLADLQGLITKLATVNKCKIIFIDYLQLVTAPGQQNRVLEIGAITRALKRMARRYNIVIVVLSQLNRGLENRQDKRPHLADLRESGDIEQDADLVMFTYRDEYYNQETSKPGIMEIIVGKNRFGKLGTVELYYCEEISLISSLFREEQGERR
jgi:replicative DNA helicase